MTSFKRNFTLNLKELKQPN